MIVPGRWYTDQHWKVFFRDEIGREFYRKVRASNREHASDKAKMEDRQAGGETIFCLRVEED